MSQPIMAGSNLSGGESPSLMMALAETGCGNPQHLSYGGLCLWATEGGLDPREEIQSAGNSRKINNAFCH